MRRAGRAQALDVLLDHGVAAMALLERGLHDGRQHDATTPHLEHELRDVIEALVHSRRAGHEDMLERCGCRGHGAGVDGIVHRVGHGGRAVAASGEEVGHGGRRREDLDVRLPSSDQREPAPLAGLAAEPVHERKELVRRDDTLCGPVRDLEIGGAGRRDQHPAGLAQQAAQQPQRLQAPPAAVEPRHHAAGPSPVCADVGGVAPGPDGDVAFTRGGGERMHQLMAMAGLAGEPRLDDVQDGGHGLGPDCRGNHRHAMAIIGRPCLQAPTA